MKNTFLAVCCIAVCCGAGAASDVNFDKTIDVKATVAEINSPDPGNSAQVPAINKTLTNSHYSEDCIMFTFAPEEPLVSDKVRLVSTEYNQECHTVQNPNGGTSQHCHTVPGMTYSRWVQTIIKPRELLPWENEEYVACLKGPWLNFYARKTAYDYDVTAEGGNLRIYTLNPLKKIPTNPDPQGITVSAFAPGAEKTLKLTLADKWSAYYAGEQTKIHVTLKRSRPFWLDATVLEQDLTLAPAASYEIALPAADAGKYYAEWGFTRLGAVSTQKHIKGKASGFIEIP